MRGRPRLIDFKGDDFQSLYFDPCFGQPYICSLFNISKKTFYRYEKELLAPKLRIGIGCQKILPKKNLLEQSKKDPYQYDLDIARLICRTLKIRGNFFFGEVSEIWKKTERGELDFSVATTTVTEERKRTLSFSHKYIHNHSPNGSLISNNCENEQSTKAILGLRKNDIHHDFALKNLAHDFDFRLYNSNESLFAAFSNRSIQNLILYSGYQDQLHGNLKFQQLLPTFYYDSYTGIFTGNSYNQWLEPINKALEFIFTEKLINESDYFNF